MRERNQRIVLQRKNQAMATGMLRCQVCSFDFARFYGAIGDGFIEAQHTVPRSMAGLTTTKASDLVLVCSNCHSMLHRHRPWPTPDELRSIIGRVVEASER